MATDMTVSKEILAQLGGGRFIMMTGAKNFVGSNDTLSFQIPLSRGINRVSITLDCNDTYRVTFDKFNARKLQMITVNTTNGIYCDQLQELFTEQTGLYTKL